MRCYPLITMGIVALALTGLHCNSDATGTDEEVDCSEFCAEGEYQGQVWPTDEWQTCTPEEVGMDSSALMSVYDYLAEPDIETRGAAIIKNGCIVAEAYFGVYNENTRHHSFSVAKSFLSATVGIAIEEGYVPGVDQLAYEAFSEWQTPETEPEKQAITVQDLLTMRSGLEWDESDYFGDGVNDAYEMGATDDYLAYALAKPSINDPGTVWNYSSGDSMLLSGIVEYYTGAPAYDLALEHLLEPIGIPDITWSHDPEGHTVGGWGVRATVREFAKFGYLYLNEGNWDGEQVVPAQWVEDSTSPAVAHYGYQWWLLPALNGYQNSDIPEDTFIAWGIYQQQIFVIPSLDLLVVRVAHDDGSPHWSEVEFLTLILDAINES